MSAFTDVLDFDLVGSGIYKTRRAFRFYLRDDRRGEYVDVPAGFSSNGASIPRWIQIAFGWKPMDLRWAQASFLHDAMVGETCAKLPIITDGKARYASWNESTKWFDAALRVKRKQYQTCPTLNRKLFVAAVKIYGLIEKPT